MEKFGFITFWKNSVDFLIFQLANERANAASPSALAEEYNSGTTRSAAEQRRLQNFLLDVVRSIFQDMNTMDVVILKIMNFAQRLVDADRASLFLVDSRRGQLHAQMFDLGSAVEAEDEKAEGGAAEAGRRKEIK